MTEHPMHPARAAAQRSMTAVAGRDRDGWLALFAPDAVVEDPVGTSPLDPDGTGHRGRDAIAAFWDQTIATMEEVGFDVHDSFACGDEVANVASIHLVMPGGARGRTDGVFVYRVDDDGRITNLRAFWEMDRMLGTVEQP